MVEFVVELDKDNKRKAAFKDGVPFDQDLQLEPVHEIVKIYFQLANQNLYAMSKSADQKEKRSFGLQAFLMSLTGLEAFANCYFHIRGAEKNLQDIVKHVDQRSSLSKKLGNLVELVGDGPLVDQEALLQWVFLLAEKRHEIVHPKWTSSSLIMVDSHGAEFLTIKEIGENPNTYFDSLQNCQRALHWCVLVVLRVAESRGNPDPAGFLFHWTGFINLTMAEVLSELGMIKPAT